MEEYFDEYCNEDGVCTVYGEETTIMEICEYMEEYSLNCCVCGFTDDSRPPPAVVDTPEAIEEILTEANFYVREVIGADGAAAAPKF